MITEEFRVLVQDEGRGTKNSIAFNVPLNQAQLEPGGRVLIRKPPTSPRILNEFKRDDYIRATKRSSESVTPGSRVRSASTGRDKKSELQARYWAFLFGNLQRAVDEIYQTCETDESVSECKEVILVLDNYTKDFHNLIEWFKLKWEYENTPPPQRPTSYAWEIRKSSPGKVRSAAGVEPNAEKQSIKLTQVNNAMEDSSSQLQSNGNEVVVNTENGIIDCAQSVVNETRENSELSEECTNLSQQNQEVLEIVQNLPEDSINVNISPHVESKHLESRETSANEILVRDVESNLEVVELKENDCNNYKNIERTISESNVEANVGEKTMRSDIIQNSDEIGVTMKDVSTNTNDGESPLTTPNLKDVNIETETNDGCITVVHQASQTDLELCVESSDGLHFVTMPQNEPPPVKSAPTLASRGPTINSRPSPRIPVQTPVRPTTVARPAYSTVSRLSSTRPPVSAPSKVLPTPTKLAPSVSRTVPRPGTATRGAPNVRLVRSRTSADVRSTGRSHIVLRPITDVNHKLQRTSTVSRQAVPSHGSRTTGPVRTERQTVSTQLQNKNSISAPRRTAVMTSCNGVIENSGINLVDGSNSSLNSSASCDKTVPPTTMSIEVLPRSADDDDTQGWEMVKGRSRTRMSLSGKADYIARGGARLGNRKSGHFHLRFHQPSAASSLPALALAEVEPLSCKSESAIAVNGHKMGRQNSSKSLLDKRKQSLLSKRNNIKDIKSQSLGADAKLKKSNKLVDEAVTSGSEDTLVNSPHVTDSKSKSLNNGKLKSDDSSSLSERVIRTEDDVLLLGSKLDDMLDEKCLFNEDELRKSKELSATEEKLRKEIHELESIDIEVDTETDETETDGEATVGTEDDGEILQNEDPLSLEARYEPMLQGMSGLDRVNVLEQLQEFVARHPGRALELHQKLSSPSRRRTLTETLRRLKDKQEQAEEKREKLRHERSQRIRELLNKVEEVKTAQAQLIEDKRVRLEMKLKRAEVNRKMHLKGIVRKAHDEEEKLKEIAFINELEAQNKRHDFMAQCQEQEERLQGIHEERQRKQEEKAAKEAAVEERRRVLEAERQERLEKMQELRRKREERVGRKQLEREKERQELAREKARDREERLSALHAAQLAVQEELQKKIQQKQEDSARRHEENIEHIRQRALESSILRCSTDDLPPRLAPYETLKLCELCNVLIGSEVYLLSHLRGKQHQESVQKQQNGASLSREELLTFSIPYIVDAPADKIDPKIAMDKERQKALKKRCKKIRLRMSSRGQEYESKREVPQKFDSPNKTRLMKCLRDVDKLHSSQGKGQWPNNSVTSLERALGEINRLLSKKSNLDQAAFQALNGFSILSNVITLAMEVPPNMAPFLPAKCYVTACTSYILACQDNKENCKYVLFSNKVSTVLDLLLHRLTDLIPDRGGTLAVSTSGGQTTLPVDNLAGALMRLLALVLTHAAVDDDGPKDDITIRIQDVISYTVSVGVVDRLAAYCSGVRDPIDSDPQGAAFLLAGLELLSTLAARCCGASRAADGGTQLTCALQVTELVGAVSMLYGALLRQGAPPRGGPAPPSPLPQHTAAVALATFKLLARVAELHLPLFQSVLGAEGISLQFRHIASYLLWHCSHNSDKELLHEVVRVVGFFAVRNADNQMMLQSGFTPTVLQQLCGLPFPYFSNPALSGLLFPTLLACCSGNQQNKAILEQELSYQLLEEYKMSEAAKSNRLVALLDG